MPTSQEQPPAGIDVTTPSVARMYDYYLGGKDNFAVDREMAEQVLAHAPEFRTMAHAGRRFLGRVVRFLAAAGIRQFVDIGSGLPTRRNVHEIAQVAIPDARVVYVDNDPMVLVHARALLADNDLTRVIHGDMYAPTQIVEHPDVREFIDFDQPVAILMFALLHLVPDDDEAHRIVTELRDAVPSGSYLAISHAVPDVRPEAMSKVASLYQQSGAVRTGPRTELRSKDEVERFFDGLTLVEPGLVYQPAWRPDAEETVKDPMTVWSVGGVGRKD